MRRRHASKDLYYSLGLRTTRSVPTPPTQPLQCSEACARTAQTPVLSSNPAPAHPCRSKTQDKLRNCESLDAVTLARPSVFKCIPTYQIHPNTCKVKSWSPDCQSYRKDGCPRAARELNLEPTQLLPDWVHPPRHGSDRLSQLGMVALQNVGLRRLPFGVLGS